MGYIELSQHSIFLFDLDLNIWLSKDLLKYEVGLYDLQVE